MSQLESCSFYRTPNTATRIVRIRRQDPEADQLYRQRSSNLYHAAYMDRPDGRVVQFSVMEFPGRMIIWNLSDEGVAITRQMLLMCLRPSSSKRLPKEIEITQKGKRVIYFRTVFQRACDVIKNVGQLLKSKFMPSAEERLAELREEGYVW